jgi:hypothetical protein
VTTMTPVTTAWMAKLMKLTRAPAKSSCHIASDRSLALSAQFSRSLSENQTSRRQFSPPP